MQPDFQISYTLDILAYINCLIDEKKQKLYDEDIKKFLPMLGTISDKYLEKLIKFNRQKPNFIEHIISILLVNDHLHDWTISELLDKHKRLVPTFKKTKQYSNASKELKKFINNDFAKVMPLVKTLATDLERLEFKKFWLEKKLPDLKERTAQYKQLLNEFNIAKHINNWAVNEKISEANRWYVLAYGGVDYKVLLKEYQVVSPIILADNFFDKVVSYGIKKNSYRAFCKVLKPTPELKNEFKKHELHKAFKKIAAYADRCFKIALKIYLQEGYGNHSQEVPESYPFANEILDYLRKNKKTAEKSIEDYITQLMKHFSKRSK